MADFTMSITIPESKLARTKQRQLANRPKPEVIFDPYFPDDPEKQIINPTFKQWMEFQFKEISRKWDKSGARILTERTIKESQDSTDMFEE